MFARTDRMYAKRFEEETNLRCQIVIDASSSMYFPEDAKGGMNKMKFAVYSAAALINLLKRQRDAAGLSVFTDQVTVNTASRSSVVHQQMLYAQLDRLLKEKPINVRTDAVKGLNEIAETVHKRSMVVIFSDMLEDMNPDRLNELFSALQHLKFNKHEVILFHVVDKEKELDFNFENRPYVFIDMETGEKVKLQAGQVKDYYVSQMAKFENELKLRCGQYKIEFVEADINKGYKQVLLPFLMKRAKMF